MTYLGTNVFENTLAFKGLTCLYLLNLAGMLQKAVYTYLKQETLDMGCPKINEVL